MAATPIFETERLCLTPRSLAETEDCLALDRAPGVTRHVDGPWHDPAAHRAFIEARTRGPYPRGMGYWSIRAKSAPQIFLGWVLLIPEDAGGPETELGWRLRPEVWGQGFATEATRPLLHHAFAILRCPRLIADIKPENAASLRVAAKLGLLPSAAPAASYRRHVLTAEAFMGDLSADPRRTG